MKFLAFTSLLLLAGAVTAQTVADTNKVLAREEPALDARHLDDTLAHARRTLAHFRRLADDHAEFVARALGEFESLERRAAHKGYASEKVCIKGECDKYALAGWIQALENCKAGCK